MQHTILSAAQISTLCGVDEHAVRRWIEEGRFLSAFWEYAVGKDHQRVSCAHVEQFLVDRGQSSDFVLIVVFSPVQGNCQTASAEVQAQIYEVDLDGEPTPALSDVPAFGDRLERLFALVTQPDGAPFTNEEIAQRAGLTDGTYVWKLRNKKWRAQDPKLSTVTALAQAFGVSPMHFFVYSDVYALLAKNRQSGEG